MRVIEETPTKLVLEMDPAQKVESPRQGLGCLGVVAFFTFTLIFIFIMFGYPYYNTSSSWLFWVIGIGVLIMEAIVIIMAIYIARSAKTVVQEATVNIDLQSQHAVRDEKLRSGKVNHYDLDLNEVSRILIHGEELGHSLKVLLDSQSGPQFEVNSDVFFDVEPMKEFGNKLGNLLKKPVVLKMTDQGNILSEEIIQA